MYKLKDNFRYKYNSTCLMTISTYCCFKQVVTVITNSQYSCRTTLYWVMADKGITAGKEITYGGFKHAQLAE